MTTEKQQTPLQKLIAVLKKKQDFFDKEETGYVCYGIAIAEAESLLPEEKQMVIDAYDASPEYAGKKFETGEQYFNETFKS
jgi:hypothetical protein